MKKGTIISIILIIASGIGGFFIGKFIGNDQGYKRGVDQYKNKQSNLALIGNDSTANEPKLVTKDLSEALGSWQIDTSSSTLDFEIEHINDITKGVFTKFDGIVDFKEDISKSSLTLTVFVASINTGNKMRDSHLVEEDYFYEEQHPVMSFRANSFEKKDDLYIAHGKLTIKEITNAVDVSFAYLGRGENTNGNKFIALKGFTQIDRTQFGMEHEANLGDNVKIEFLVEMTPFNSL